MSKDNSNDDYNAYQPSASPVFSQNESEKRDTQHPPFNQFFTTKGTGNYHSPSSKQHVISKQVLVSPSKDVNPDIPQKESKMVIGHQISIKIGEECPVRPPPTVQVTFVVEEAKVSEQRMKQLQKGEVQINQEMEDDQQSQFSLKDIVHEDILQDNQKKSNRQRQYQQQKQEQKNQIMCSQRQQEKSQVREDINSPHQQSVADPISKQALYELVEMVNKDNVDMVEGNERQAVENNGKMDECDIQSVNKLDIPSQQQEKQEQPIVQVIVEAQENKQNIAQQVVQDKVHIIQSQDNNVMQAEQQIPKQVVQLPKQIVQIAKQVVELPKQIVQLPKQVEQLPKLNCIKQVVECSMQVQQGQIQQQQQKPQQVKNIAINNDQAMINEDQEHKIQQHEHKVVQQPQEHKLQQEQVIQECKLQHKLISHQQVIDLVDEKQQQQQQQPQPQQQQQQQQQQRLQPLPQSQPQQQRLQPQPQPQLKPIISNHQNEGQISNDKEDVDNRDGAVVDQNMANTAQQKDAQNVMVQEQAVQQHKQQHIQNNTIPNQTNNMSNDVVVLQEEVSSSINPINQLSPSTSNNKPQQQPQQPKQPKQPKEAQEQTDLQSMRRSVFMRQMKEVYPKSRGIRRVNRVIIDEITFEDDGERVHKVISTQNGAFMKKTSNKQQQLNQYISQIQTLLHKIKDMRQFL